jgi:hypothetical protein
MRRSFAYAQDDGWLLSFNQVKESNNKNSKERGLLNNEKDPKKKV